MTWFNSFFCFQSDDNSAALREYQDKYHPCLHIIVIDGSADELIAFTAQYIPDKFFLQVMYEVLMDQFQRGESESRIED